MLAKPELFSPPDEVCCWPRRRAEMLRPGQRSGDVAGRDAVAELLLAGAPWRKPSGISCWPERRGGAASGSQQTHTKREGPGRDLNISPEPLLFIALRKGNTPGDEAEPPFTACMQCLHAVLAQLPLQLCRDCKEGCSKCKNCVELWEYGKDKGVTEYVLSV